MDISAILKVVQDYFTFPIPLGVCVLIVLIMIVIFVKITKQTNENWEKLFESSGKIDERYSNQTNYLEEQLDNMRASSQKKDAEIKRLQKQLQNV